MFIDDVDKEWIIVANTMESKEYIQLYNQLSIALKMMKDMFEVIDSGVNNGIEFSIVTKYPDDMPINISSMFFNIDNKFDVKIEETLTFAYCGLRHFLINIKKY